MRKYRKNDWWDFMTVIEQELDRDKGYRTFLNLADELKWRLVESISEGGNFKIKKRMQELQDEFLENCSDLDKITPQERSEIQAIFDFVD
ncbi:MAG: hypothetical protein NXH75_16770 [Halobacteriovoraceae bacterium]|nr:hypothetical protein [Halobacteriovoraceae bacterium]